MSEKVSISGAVINLLKDITSKQGGQWIEKKNLRTEEAVLKSKMDFNPKAARTRSF